MAQRKLNHHDHLLAGLRKRNRDAQFQAYKQYSVAMLNTAIRIVGNKAEAEDVLQEAFLAAFTKIDKYKGDSTFGAWLRRIVVNKSINILQKRKVSLVPLDELPLDLSGEQVTESPDTPLWNIDQIMHAVNDLPDGYRVVFSLYLLEGYNHREISQILNISEGGSKSQYNRAKKKLREILTTPSYV
ncbi:MAG TPA: RNA polymerase sigma factor [Bacteroidetes bacterium]|nr:RNA polymerase sigma factor [Bacteroidota bacterium]